METVRVNMTPNNEVKTIHCSQNDGNTRKWGFELYKEDGVIDSSSIKEQMLFNAYKGGTEQILPENTSTPTTSPIIADIQYKDALRSEQEFLYRESPATEDGQARITKIKGNTIKFNQLVQNGNFATDTFAQKGNNASVTVNNNVGTFNPIDSSTAGNRWVSFNEIYINTSHKYYFTYEYIYNSTQTNSPYFNFNGGGVFNNYRLATLTDHTTGWHKINSFLNFGNNSYVGNTYFRFTYDTVSDISMKNVMLIDLTSMSIDNLTTTQEVEQWLSSYIGNLPYYDYTLGTLISFSASSLKTVGKNLCPYKSLSSSSSYFDLLAGEYVITFKLIGSAIYSTTSVKIINKDGVTLASVRVSGVSVGTTLSINLTLTEQTSIYIECTNMNPGEGGLYIDDIQVEFGTTATSYEPYTTSTISLPISTCFPTGMKSAGNVYDELTENKAITRIGSRAYESGDESDTTVITDGTTTYYPLATESETDITTASLVTEKGEAPLYYSSGLKADCNETISSEAGLFDAKIKVVDSETVYSQKLQLHVEKQP